MLKYYNALLKKDGFFLPRIKTSANWFIAFVAPLTALYCFVLIQPNKP